MNLNQEKIFLLEEAYKIIEGHKQAYICYAIREAMNIHCLWKAGHALTSYISAMIYPSFSLESWLCYNGYAHESDVRLHEPMRLYRLAWIKHLIKELQTGS